MKQEERDADICVNEYGTDGGRPSSGEKAKKPAKMIALVFKDKEVEVWAWTKFSKSPNLRVGLKQHQAWPKPILFFILFI